MAAPIICGHDVLRLGGSVEALAFSPSAGALAAGAGMGDGVRVWELPGLALIGRAARPASSLVFAPDGHTLWLSYAASYVLRLPGGTPEALAGSGGIGAPLSLSPDGTHVVGCRPPGDREEIVLVEVRSGDAVWAVPTAGPRVSSLSFSPDGQRIAVGELNGARLLEATSGRTVRRLDAPPGRLAWVASLRRDGRFAVGSTGSQRIDLLDGDGARERVAQLPFELDRFAVDHEGRRLAVLGAAGEVAVVTLPDGVVSPLPVRRPSSGDPAVAIADRWVAVSHHRSVVLYDLQAGAEVVRSPAHRDQVTAIATAPHGRWIATAGGFDGTVRLWRSSDGAHLRALEGHGNLVTGIAVSPDGRRVTTACADDELRHFDVSLEATSGPRPAERIPTGSEPCAVASLPDGSVVAIGADGVVTARTETSVRRVADVGAGSYTGVTPRLAASADGRWLAASGTERQVVVVDLNTGLEALRRRSCGRVLAVAAHAPLLAVREEEDTVVIEVPSGEVVRRWEGVRAVAAAFGPDGRLAIARFDGPPLVVDASGAVGAAVPEGVDLPATAIAFMPDGRLALGLADGRAWIVRVPEGPLSPFAREARERERRQDEARHLLSALAQHRPAAGYRDSLAAVHLQAGGLAAVVDRGSALAEVRVFVPDASTTQLRIAVHAGAVPPPATPSLPPAAFASRMARWIRRRLGRPERPDERAATDWLGALPGIQAARAARSDHTGDALEVEIELHELPSVARLMEWIDGCVAAGTSPARSSPPA